MSHSSVDCPLCAKTQRADNLLRHCKSQHAEVLVAGMSKIAFNHEERISYFRHNEDNKHTVVIYRNQNLPAKPIQFAVCLVCGKGEHEFHANNSSRLSPIGFYTSHTGCRDQWRTVSWLFGVGKKPKAKPRGIRGPKSEAAEGGAGAFEAPLKSEAVPKSEAPPKSEEVVKSTIADQFPDEFDRWGYETGEESDEECDQDYRNERQEQRAMTLQQMLGVVATKLNNLKTKQAEKRAAVRAAAPKPASCTSCIVLNRQVDTAEQETYAVKQELYAAQELIASLRKQIDSLNTTIDSQQKTIKRWVDYADEYHLEHPK